MTKTYKILLPCFILAFVAFAVLGFIMPSTAKAVENITTTFESNRYHDLLFTYQESFLSDTTNLDLINIYRAFWYIDFQVNNDTVQAFFYSLDTNFNRPLVGEQNGVYTRKELNLRSFSDTSTSEDYFTFTNTTGGSNSRILEYVCQYEQFSSTVNNSTPTALTVTYRSLDDVIWNFTAGNYDLNVRNNAYCVTTYTWSNDYYRISLSFVAQYTRDFWDSLNVAPYSYTMYFDNNVTGQGGYDLGFQNGIIVGENKANSTVNIDSESYKAGFNYGYEKGLDGDLDWTFIFKSASDLLSFKIFGTFSILDILTVVMAVSIALIFLKMFAGG